MCSACLLGAADGDVSQAQVSQAQVSQGQAALARLPLRFEENRGQFDPAVRYAARAGGYRVQLSAAGASLAMPGAQRVDMGLVNSNPSAKIEALERMAARTDYFVGSRDRWHTGIANYSRVRYGGVYPGIDVVYYGNQGSLEYDFVLQPGADPRAIRMKFRGGVKAVITAEGDLALEFGGRRILQKKPVIYQPAMDRNATGDLSGTSRREVAGRYTLLGRNQVGLRLADYDRTRTLVIDPILVFCTYMGGSGAEQITAIKLDSKGRLYITGSTTTAGLPTINGAYSDHILGLTNIFIAILDTTAADHSFPLIYFSYMGGSSLDIPTAMDVDSSGVIYLTGTTTSTDFPMSGNSVQTTGAGSEQQAFVAVIDPSLYGGVSLIYSTYLGGTTGTNTGRGIAVGPNGHIYVIGTTASTDFPVTTSAYAQVIFGPQDAFICQLDRNSTSLVYSTYLGGELDDDGRSIAVGSNGLVYFGATTNGTQFPMEGPGFRQALLNPPNTSIIIGVMDMTQFGEPSLVYSTYFGGSSVSEVRKIALDSQNRVMLTGYTLSTDFPITVDAVQSQAGGNGDAFVSLVNPNDPPHFLVYSTYLGGSQGEVAYDVTGDTAGNIYVTGYTLSPDFPVNNAPQGNWGGGTDLFITKLQPGTAGQSGLLFSTYFGAKGVYVGTGIAVGPDGSVYTAGNATVGLPSSFNGNGFSGGLSDGFVLVLK
jgi:Beta-propeller repeat